MVRFPVQLVEFVILHNSSNNCCSVRTPFTNHYIPIHGDVRTNICTSLFCSLYNVMCPQEYPRQNGCSSKETTRNKKKIKTRLQIIHIGKMK